jgi:hypothetical protein
MKKKYYALAALAIAAVVAIIAQTSTPTTVVATKGYRYWGYYQSAAATSTWVAAMTGPTVDIADGSVEGWIFTFSNDDIPSTPPSVKPDFESICGNTSAKNGFKRVGLVIDFGVEEIAPSNEKPAKTITRCVVTEEKSQGIDVLNQTIELRTAESGLLCGINGYPAKECGVEIATPEGL